MKKNTGSKRAITKYELEAIIDSWSDEETEADKIYVIPSDKVDENTDQEDFDDDLIVTGDVSGL